MTCKIAKCAAPIYRANLCRAHYAHWLEHCELPGPTKAGRGAPLSEDDVYMKRSQYSKMMRLANAVAQAAKKYNIDDDALAEALYAWEDAK